MAKVVTRFAPSPTGLLHIGGLRTAFFNWLWARKNGGKFILRIEDTDRQRLVNGAVENILQALEWYGLDFDEGPVFQSERLEKYKMFANQLLEQGHAYRCFCTPARLEEVRKIQKANKQATGYDGFCRSLTDEEVKSNLAAGKKFVVRLKVPKEGNTEFRDKIYGAIKVENINIDDQILIKSDGYPTYHLANVVDDHEQGVSHVIRAEEWLPSTPKHIILYRALGWTPPVFAHLPIVLGADRSKLSKRHGAVAALEYKNMGYLPEAVLNFIALLGWNPKTDREFFSIEELKKEFSLEKINKASAVFNTEKLDWLNGRYIKRMPLDLLEKRIRPFTNLSKEGIDTKSVLRLVRERMKRLSDFDKEAGFLYTKELVYSPDLLVPKDESKDKTLSILELSLDFIIGLDKKEDFNLAALKDKFSHFIKKNNFSNREVLWPLRVAVTGQAKSPGVFEVISILGKESSIARIKKAIYNLKRI